MRMSRVLGILLGVVLAAVLALSVSAGDAQAAHRSGKGKQAKSLKSTRSHHAAAKRNSKSRKVFKKGRHRTGNVSRRDVTRKAPTRDKSEPSNTQQRPYASGFPADPHRGFASSSSVSPDASGKTANASSLAAAGSGKSHSISNKKLTPTEAAVAAKLAAKTASSENAIAHARISRTRSQVLAPDRCARRDDRSTPPPGAAPRSPRPRGDGCDTAWCRH